VLPHRLLENARILVEDGRIVGVDEANGRARGRERIDVGGSFVLPGAVDIHGDGLEQQIRPRPKAEMPMRHAVHAADRVLAAAGVTTTFHAVKFSDDPIRERTHEGARRIVGMLHEYGGSADRLVDHLVLHRLDVRSPGSWEALAPSLLSSEAPYVSIDDNQPGQGQFRDLRRYAEILQPKLLALGMSFEEYAEHQLREKPEVVEANLSSLRAARRKRRFPIASHDDDSAAQVRERHNLGATVAEFPVVEEAAEEAASLGMPVVLGAPNALRGSSLSGNLSARGLMRRGLAGVLCSDYSPWSLWWTVFALAGEGYGTLPELTRMVSLNPARAVGLDRDRGAIATGLRADLAVARLSGGIPKVETTFVAGRPVHSAIHSAF
jgi:alpha-D-ribose 1-methylphosphonate 5-triphosphate diphosphatase